MNRISVSFPYQYEQEYKHVQKLKKRTNISLYICELIRKDMQDTDLEKRIEQIIDSKLKNVKMQGVPVEHPATTDDELKNAAAAFEL